MPERMSDPEFEEMLRMYAQTINAFTFEGTQAEWIIAEACRARAEVDEKAKTIERLVKAANAVAEKVCLLPASAFPIDRGRGDNFCDWNPSCNTCPAGILKVLLAELKGEIEEGK
jgi:hypothetical protein